MVELPLFPLNLVLFPGMPLNLHIFEERYKLMINECIDGRKPFGVVLIANKQLDTSTKAEPHLIGCTAQIMQVQPLQQGRMNIAAIGRERFQIHTLSYDKPYLYGEAEMIPMLSDISEQTRQAAASLRRHLKRYLGILQQSRQFEFDTRHIPNDPATLAHLASVLLQVEPQEKQHLLEIKRIDELINRLLGLYRHEVALLGTLLNPPDNIDFKDTFSLN